MNNTVELNLSLIILNSDFLEETKPPSFFVHYRDRHSRNKKNTWIFPTSSFMGQETRRTIAPVNAHYSDFYYPAEIIRLYTVIRLAAAELNTLHAGWKGSRRIFFVFLYIMND
jgi:hypothetical protein